MEAGLPGCFIRPDTTSPHLSRPSTLISLCSSQEQKGEGKIQWRNSSEVYGDPGNKYTWFTWEVILGTMGLGNWESDTGKRGNQQRVLMNRAGSGHLGLSPAGGPLRDCRTLFKLSQRRMRNWGCLSTNSHLSLFEGCSQAGHQLSSTVGRPVRNEHAPVAKESPRWQYSAA